MFPFPMDRKSAGGNSCFSKRSHSVAFFVPSDTNCVGTSRMALGPTFVLFLNVGVFTSL